MLMRIFNYHRHKLPVILLFTTFFLVSCGGGPDGKSICVWPYCTSAENSEYPTPGTFTGISAYAIPASSSVPEVTYEEDPIPQVLIPIGTERTMSKPRYRELLNIVKWEEYNGFKFKSQTEQFEKEHEVLLFTDKVKGEDDYLTFGVWLTMPKQAKDNHPVVAFAIGGDPFKGEFTGLPGTAKYEGPAVGIYGIRASGSETGETGSFTAKASLRANFSDGSVNGEVTDFIKKRGGRFGALKVKLIFGDKNDGANFGGNTRISTGEDADVMSEGEWNGNFYGNGNGHLSSVAGTFNAKTGDKTKVFVGIVGAFGAKKMP